MRAVCVVVMMLGLLSACLSAPLTCDNLLNQRELTTEEIVGKWMYIGGSSELPGSKSFGHLLQSAWLDIRPSTESSTLEFIQAQRLYGGQCSTFAYNVTFENSALSMKHPFLLHEIFLKNDECPDCLVAYETITSGSSTYSSLMFFSKRKTVSHKELEVFHWQLKCLGMTSPIMMKREREMCPDPDLSSPSFKLEDINAFLTSRMGRGVATVMDTFFELFVN